MTALAYLLALMLATDPTHGDVAEHCELNGIAAAACADSLIICQQHGIEAPECS